MAKNLGVLLLFENLFVLKTPNQLANYCYDLAKTFNSFYGELSVMNEEDKAKRDFRLALISEVASTLKKGMKLLGIDVPERM